MKNKKTKLALIAKLFGGLCLVALLVFNLNSVVNNENSSGLSLASLMTSVNAQVELPEVVIKCSSGDSGDCFYVSVEEGMFGACRFDCTFSGAMKDHCDPMWVLFVNFCSAYGQS